MCDSTPFRRRVVEVSGSELEWGWWNFLARWNFFSEIEGWDFFGGGGIFFRD